MKTVNANGWTDATAVLAAAAHDAAEDVEIHVRHEKKGYHLGILYYSKDGGWFRACINGVKKVFWMTVGWMVRFYVWVAGLFGKNVLATATGPNGEKIEVVEEATASVTNAGKHKRQQVQAA